MTLAPEAALAVHAVLEFTGIALGAVMYRKARVRNGLSALMAPGGFAILVGLLLGAGIGNKLVFLIERPDVVASWWQGRIAFPGQSVVGGLLGGLIGVEIAKRWTRQPQSTGDLMVWPIACGLAIGRVGCFIAGVLDDTYGLPTALPWGVDFGDGIRRHPVQLYEIGVVLLLASLLHRHRAALSSVPGLRFKLFLTGYLLWRWGIDGLKPVPVAYPLGWSGIQWVCVIALMIYLPFVVAACKRLAAVPGHALRTP